MNIEIRKVQVLVIMFGLLVALMTGCMSTEVEPKGSTKFQPYTKDQQVAIYLTGNLRDKKAAEASVGQPLLQLSEIPAYTVVGDIEVSTAEIVGFGAICKQAKAEARKLGANALIYTSVEHTILGYEHGDERLPIYGGRFSRFQAVHLTELKSP